MASLLLLLESFIFLSLPWLFISSATSSNPIPQVNLKPYVVYMGSSSNGDREDVEAAELSHLQLLSSISSRQESQQMSLLHHYFHAFRGFSAMLTESEASRLSGHDKVLSVFPDPVLQLHTTRSWDFLEVGSSEQARSQYHHPSNDVIIGIIDTGIWPESPSFSDEGVDEVPQRWKGTCMEASDFKKSNCNRKLIGARYYGIQSSISNGTGAESTKASGSPRDSVGHGTHTASTAGGSLVANASYYGLAKGTARGGLPSTRIASYKACTEEGCSGSVILKAMDDAIKDGVDIISISIGSSSIFQADYLHDPIAIGAFHAEQMGVLVVCSGGNDGPDSYTVVNTAPWIFTAAASSIDRDLQSAVVLGNGRTFKGSAINLSNLTRSKKYPLVSAKNAAANFTPADEARNCLPGSIDRTKVAGKIVICIDTDPMGSTRIKTLVVEDAKAKGMILISENQNGVPFDSGVFPFTQVDHVAGYKILKYISSAKYPTANILETTTVSDQRPAPTVASFSSRGPGDLTENILKPDIMAPGVAILAADIPKNDPGSVPFGKKPSKFSIKSGTSMACPHVTGAAAIIKSVHRGWSSSMIKSALMTTATFVNNEGKPLKNSSRSLASPHETGAGEISPYRALHPGLVFETTTKDYLMFLCYIGYSQKNVSSMASFKFRCPENSVGELISDVNYPSISISNLNRHGSARVVARTVTNVGPVNSTYVASVDSPMGLTVKVNPSKIDFRQNARRVSYNVSFDGKEAPGGYNFGSLTWSDGRHSVRTVFAVNVK
ncbi:CO(2)-response secreted protease-like isoform X1 [Rhodamnia argentea]|uniref:CO(2)-response secreted protease-like isoform X1 n=2 Tax=Rhodamnia argentea TaxID=178133 RepID=A0A8B8PIB0_9MYRT|nr:CO(2)-response secreted protease-like isoform X1 [Rhodamnia argentea]